MPLDDKTALKLAFALTRTACTKGLVIFRPDFIIGHPANPFAGTLYLP